MKTIKLDSSFPELGSIYDWFGVTRPSEEPLVFDERLRVAVIRFQAEERLSPDGIIGPKTRAEMVARGWRWPPSDEEKDAAADAGVPVSILRAIMLVEGGDRDANVIRFEPHIMRRLLGDRNRPDDAAKIPMTLRPGRVASSVRSETGVDAFYRAMEVDPELAVRSTSWGRYQVMGINLLKMYPDPTEAVIAFYSDPEGVSLRLVAAWFKARPDVVAQVNRTHPDYAKVAARYNGRRYAENRYDKKLRLAHQQARLELGE